MMCLVETTFVPTNLPTQCNACVLIGETCVCVDQSNARAHSLGGMMLNMNARLCCRNLTGIAVRVRDRLRALDVFSVSRREHNTGIFFETTLEAEEFGLGATRRGPGSVSLIRQSVLLGRRVFDDGRCVVCCRPDPQSSCCVTVTRGVGGGWSIEFCYEVSS